MTSKEHAKLLGLLFWIYVGFQVIVSIFAGLMATAMTSVMIPELAKMPRRAGEPNPEVFLSWIPVIIIFAMILGFIMMIPKVVAGYGLRNGKSWAKIWAIIACCLAVLNIPFGLAIGIYGFWFIFGDAGKEYFGSSDLSNQIPPPPNNWK